MAGKNSQAFPSSRSKKLFCFGYSYTASFLVERLRRQRWDIAGTTTDDEKLLFMKRQGIEALLFDNNAPLNDPFQTLKHVTHVLVSIPPGADGDIVAKQYGADLARMPQIEWVGYLSTTGVYGNQDGGWVDEKTVPEPTSRRGELRMKAEQQWQQFYQHDGLPLHIFRLAGIYGPGRSAIDSVRAGTARRIEKQGHVFNRIHVEDIAAVLEASMLAPEPGEIYNLADDLPSGSAEVITFACNLLGLDPPPLVSFDRAELAPIVRSFYKDNKRLRNDKIKDALGVTLKYPDYRAGLQACLEIEASTAALLAFEHDEAKAS